MAFDTIYNFSNKAPVEELLPENLIREDRLR